MSNISHNDVTRWHRQHSGVGVSSHHQWQPNFSLLPLVSSSIVILSLVWYLEESYYASWKSKGLV